jgi:cobalamin biosynthesis Mg chelatase CobN
MTARLVVVVLTWATASACSAPSEMADLAGTYVLSIQTDTLRLDSTGRYARTYAQLGTPKRVTVDSGRWGLSRDRRLVALYALPQRWPEHGRFDPKTGRWHEADTTVRRTQALVIGSTWRGEVTLGVQPEIGWRYRRLFPD